MRSSLSLTAQLTVLCSMALSTSVAVARPVTFSVVAFGQAVKVDVGGTTFPLTAPWPSDPFFNATVEVPYNVKSYKYVVDAASEPFDRTLDAGTSKTFNDFYGRQVTIQPLAQFTSPDQSARGQWTRNSRPEIFDDSYIPTVHFSGSAAEEWVTSAKDASVDVLFVSKSDVMKYSAVSAGSKNNEFAKAALRLDFKGEDFYGRSAIKFRDSVEDATMMREKIYTDMLQAAGCPSMETINARVYYNMKPLGLYVLQDEASNEGFIASAMYGNTSDSVNRPQTLGIPLNGGTGADFLWTNSPRTPKDPWDAFIAPVGKTNDRVVALSKALNDLDVTSATAVADFEKNWFDIDTFFKAIAFEYLTGHWDSYWFFTTNFVVYDDPNESTAGKNKFYFIDQDFDGTFGVALGPPYNTVGAAFTSQSYKDLLARKWKLSDIDAADRTMVNKLLKAPSVLTPRFEQTLVDIVKRLFNPNAFKVKLDSLSARMRPEVAWDRGLTYPHAGKNYGYTIEDFDNGIQKAVPKASNQWGIMQWVTERSAAVSKEFNFQFDSVVAPNLPAGGQSAGSDTVMTTKPSSAAVKGSQIPIAFMVAIGFVGTLLSNV